MQSFFYTKSPTSIRILLISPLCSLDLFITTPLWLAQLEKDFLLFSGHKTHTARISWLWDVSRGALQEEQCAYKRWVSESTRQWTRERLSVSCLRQSMWESPAGQIRAVCTLVPHVCYLMPSQWASPPASRTKRRTGSWWTPMQTPFSYYWSVSTHTKDSITSIDG